jgi:hypothetical protein
MGAVINLAEDTHSNCLAGHSVLQETWGYCFWRHLEPTSHHVDVVLSMPN